MKKLKINFKNLDLDTVEQSMKDLLLNILHDTEYDYVLEEYDEEDELDPYPYIIKVEGNKLGLSIEEIILCDGC